MHDAHRWPQSRAPGTVQLAELAVLVGLRPVTTRSNAIEVLRPQELQRHAAPMQLLVNVAVVDRCPRRRNVTPAVTEQRRFELSVRHLLSAFPRHAGLPRASELAAHRAHRHAQRAGDLALAAPEMLQPKEFTNLSHAEAFRHARGRHTSERCWLRARLCPVDPSSPRARARWPAVFKCVGISVQVRRNRRSSHFGIGARVPSESALEWLRNTHYDGCGSVFRRNVENARTDLCDHS